MDILSFLTDPTINPSQFSRYRAQLPINGNVGQSGFSVVFDQASSDLFPTQYFTLENVNGDGTYIRLISPLDRDVSIISYHFYPKFEYTLTFTS